MNAATAKALTDAFNAGYAHASEGKGISGRFAFQGKARAFWEAGFAKAEKDLAPARAAAAAADREWHRNTMQEIMVELAVGLHNAR